MKRLRFCGINLNSEIKEKGGETIPDFKEIPINFVDNFSIFSTAIYEFSTAENKLEIKSSIMTYNVKILEFKQTIKKACASNEVCWILLIDGSILCYNFIDQNLKEIQPQKLNEKIIDICCTQALLFGITSQSHLHQISLESQTTIYEFPKHQKIKKIVAGEEHCLLLSSNGDVFSFGCGLRGTLGHGDVNSCETPKQIEALAGLKITDIAAGSFHSIATSSFGDVYVFGWNTNGQLGLPKIAQSTFENASRSHQQVFTCPQLIELKDDDEAIQSVYCGAKHSVLLTERNRIFVAGLNNYGQLGLSISTEDVDKFTEVPLKNIGEKPQIFCGYWSTYLLSPCDSPITSK